MKNIFLLAIATFGLSFIATAQNRVYVNASATGGNNGQSWGDAFSDLQTALQAVQPGDEVWVAQGVYYPTSSADRTISFEPKSGVQLYGGFAGNETTLGQRDWAAHITFLSGDIGIDGDSTDNSLNVVYLFQPDSNTVFDGFTVCFGTADDLSAAGSSRDRAICGGGLYIEAGNWDAFPNIQNCRFWRNSSNSFGGAVMTNGTSMASVAPRFVNCRFEENRSQGSGGGLARFGGSWAERGKEFEGCYFSQNHAALHGGGLFYSDTQGPNAVALYGCSFEGNRAANKGGGAYFQAGKSGKSGQYIQNCVFEANNALEGAAIEFFTNGNDFIGEAVMDSCSFFRNTSLQIGNTSSIIYSDQFGSTQTVVKISNSKFEGNNNSAKYTITINWVSANVILDRVLFFRDTGGLFLTGSVTSVEVKNSRFSSNLTGNFADNNFEYLNPLLSARYSNCLFDKNQSISDLGCLNFTDIDSAAITNCTFTENKNIDEYLVFSPIARVVLKNVITKKNPSASYFLSNSGFYCSSSLLDYPDCQSLPPNVTCGPNNLFNLNPLFRDTANHDYSLLPCSPLINAGSNAAAAGILTDIAGNPRIQGGTVDIGAYEAPAFALAAAPEVHPACVGASNGSISLSPVFGCEPYDYNWSPAAGNGPELNGLPPGNYLLTITDGSGRQILDTVQVGAVPMPVLNPVATDVQCGTTVGGSISAGTSSGTMPYHYQWQPSAADTSLLTHLSPGAYSLTVVDANGCQDSASASIFLLGMISLMVDGKSIPCYGETGWLSATPVTGASPFSWLWQGWPGLDALAQPLGPGTYSVTVSDAFGCTASFAFPPMNQPDSLWATVGTSPQKDLVMPDGAAVVTTISGGTSPFGFDWNTGSTQQAIASLTAGNYTVTVTDKNGCEAVVEVVVDLMVSSTEEAAGRALMMYPNPTVDWVKVVLPTNSGEWAVELCDEAGRVLRSVGLSEASTCTLNLSGLPSGNYLVRVRNGTGKEMFVGKVTKI